ncbi:MAG TPA: hypothetical protein VM097_06170 [Mycobacteriales bacterium]|nr:hypothetical protein [Mycobacteriales bacterium]
MTTTPATDLRPHLVLQALSVAGVCAALMGLAHAGRLPLLVGVAVLQLLLLLAFLALVEAPASGGVFLLGMATAVAADLTVHLDDGGAGGLAGVIALALVASLLHQLVRRNRTRVTESFGDTLVVVVLVASAAALPAALAHPEGETAVRVGLLAGGAALVVGRVADLVLQRFAVAPGASRGWPGVVLALTVGVALAVPEAGDHLTHREAMLVGLACAAAAAVADLFVDLAALEVVGSRAEERRRGALRPVIALLPFALVAPVLLTAVRLLERT